ncbi:MAG: hypothetical protein ACI4XL_10900 [Bacillus sp. (in: firmicutes)]
MSNKMTVQILSGVLLFISYFISWAYDGGIYKTSANDLANMELWGGKTPFLMNFLPILPVLGVGSIYLGWVKKYSYVYNLVVIIILTPVILRTAIFLFEGGDKIAIQMGFYLAVLGVVASAYSIVIVKRELQGKEKEELQLVINKAKEIFAKLEKK